MTKLDKLFVDEKAFNDTFNENKLYKPDIDHHWLYSFVSYYESCKLASSKHRDAKQTDEKGRPMTYWGGKSTKTRDNS